MLCGCWNDAVSVGALRDAEKAQHRCGARGNVAPLTVFGGIQMRSILSGLAGLVLLAGCEAATTYDSGAVVLDISEPEAFNSRLETTTTFIDATKAIEAGDYTRAEAMLDKALAQKPRDPYALLAMGSLHERTGRFNSAEDYYRSAERYGFAAAGPRIVDGETVPSEAGLTVSDAARENLARLAE